MNNKQTNLLTSALSFGTMLFLALAIAERKISPYVFGFGDVPLEETRLETLLILKYFVEVLPYTAGVFFFLSIMLGVLQAKKSNWKLVTLAVPLFIVLQLIYNIFFASTNVIVVVDTLKKISLNSSVIEISDILYSTVIAHHIGLVSFVLSLSAHLFLVFNKSKEK